MYNNNNKIIQMKAQCVCVCLSPPCSQRNTICIYSAQQCGPRFWCQWEGAGAEGMEDM